MKSALKTSTEAHEMKQKLHSHLETIKSIASTAEKKLEEDEDEKDLEEEKDGDEKELEQDE